MNRSGADITGRVGSETILRIRKSEILKLIGNTPLARIEFDEVPPGVHLMAKLESRNPGGSVKDRAALQIVRDAIERGKLDKGKALLDSTSGNTGVAYALIGAALGIDITLCLPKNASRAKQTFIEAMGTEVVYTDPMEGSDGAQIKAEQMLKSDPDKYFYANQYENPSNPKAHMLTTGPEIWRQTYGMVTHVVAGIGTSGTVMGLSAYFKKKDPNIKIIGFEPATALHGLEGLKHLETSIVPPIFDEKALDGREFVHTEDATDWVHRLATEKGLLVGPSSGAAMAVGIKVAKKAQKGVVVVIFPDGGERYLPR